jgi:hypothetical protein
MRNSIRATYDSRETGPRYTVTTEMNGQVQEWRKPIDDPFVTTTVKIGHRWTLLRAFLRGRLDVTVSVDGDGDIVEDVLELDDNYLGINCTRRAAFNSHINEALHNFADENAG